MARTAAPSGHRDRAHADPRRRPSRTRRPGSPTPTTSTACSRAIDPDQRAVVVLRYYLDLTLPEAAAALGIPLGTAKSRLNRALAAMRITIADDELVAAPSTKERFA